MTADGQPSHVRTVRLRMTLKSLLELLSTSVHGGYPVADGAAPNHRMIGFLLRNRLTTVLNRILLLKRTTNLELTESHFAVTLNSKRTKLLHSAVEMEGMIQEVNHGEGENAMVDLSPFIDRSTLTVQVGFPMSKVYTLFRSLGLRHLCVVNEKGECVGILTRKELMCAFDRDLM
jgi:chloride channel 7